MVERQFDSFIKKLENGGGGEFKTLSFMIQEGILEEFHVLIYLYKMGLGKSKIDML